MSMMFCTECWQLRDTDWDFGSWSRDDLPDDPWICDNCCERIEEPEDE